jgi:GNAT superfamily N-acetyltransferase
MITTRLLAQHELSRYGEFMRARDLESRALYFGIGANDEFIQRIADRIQQEPDQNHIVVAENAVGEIVGLVHLAHMDHCTVELGFMVQEQNRRMGVSNRLMDHALTWCRNHGLVNIYMHCLGWNQPVIHLTRKYGLSIRRESGDADAYVVLPPAGVLSLQTEAIMEQTNWMARFTQQIRDTLTVQQ